jgi:hypothetical protein
MITDQVPPHVPQPDATGSGLPSTRASRPRWLVAAVAAVVVLAALIGVVAGMTLNSRHSGGSASAAADYVPADATVYCELRLDLPGDQRANFETLLGHFPAEAKAMLLEGGLDTLLDQGAGPQPSGLRYTTDFKPWFDGTLAMAMLGYPHVSPSAGMTPVVPDMLVFVGVKDADAARAAIDRLRSDAGMRKATSTMHDGFTIWSLPASQADAAGFAFAWTVTANEVVMGTSSDLVAGALDVHAGGKPALSDRTEFRDGLARLPADRVATFSVDTAAILEAVQSQMASAAPSAAPLFDAMTTQAVTYAVGSARFEGDRLVMDESAALPSDATASNHDTKLAESVPGDAFLYASAGDVGKGLATSIQSMLDAFGTSIPAEQLQQLQSILGGDLPSLVSWIGDTAAVAGETGDQPYVGLVITPTDAHEASVRLLQLQGLLLLSGSSGGPAVTVTEADHNGTRITTLRFDVPPSYADVPGALSWATTLQYAVTDTRVVIGTGTSFVARVLDMTRSESLAGQARFSDAVEAVGGSSNMGMTWIDLAGIRTASERAMRTQLPPGVDQWLAPFDYLAAATRVDAGRLEAHAILVVK